MKDFIEFAIQIIFSLIAAFISIALAIIVGVWLYHIFIKWGWVTAI